MISPFRNEPLLDFAQESNAGPMRDAVSSVESKLSGEYSPIIAGKRYPTGDLGVSRNPSKCAEAVGRVHQATAELAEKAIQEASRAYESWRKVSPEVRARHLLRFAAALRRRKAEYSAWLVFEAGKSWLEADIDVAEAIDFAEFYAREMLRYAEPQPLIPTPGEQNELYYVPLGVGIVIPPWNFPLAITVGMTLAAVVAGNTVVLKPSSDAPVIAAKFVELLEECGLPPGVVNYLPGSGGKIGDYLVGHAKTRFIAFTGSKEVGEHINRLAAQTAGGQIWLKRVVAEMGGKNAIIVDETADLTAAAEGIVISAYCYSGQKCSACSRLIATDSIYDELIERVTSGASALKVGEVKRPESWMGPVISQKAYQTILDYINVGRNEGKVTAGGGPLSDDQKGWFVAPTVISEVAPDARVAQEEIFGPVLSAIRVKDFDQALEVANGTQYGLTGAVYSNDRERLETARREFHAGNLYLNRKCTGALVGVQPFGGFNMSGTDSKAGGRDYLLLFLQAKSVSEKL